MDIDEFLDKEIESPGEKDSQDFDVQEQSEETPYIEDSSLLKEIQSSLDSGNIEQAQKFYLQFCEI